MVFHTIGKSFHIFLVYIGGNFALFLPIFVNTCKPLSTHVN